MSILAGVGTSVFEEFKAGEVNAGATGRERRFFVFRVVVWRASCEAGASAG